MVNKMYNSNYSLGALTLEEIIEFIKLLDELLILDRETIMKSMMVSFRLLLSNTNWLTILKQMYDYDIFADLVNEVILFFRDNILVGDDFVKNDPLEDVDMNSEMGKKLCSVMREKIGYLNKQLGYNAPYARKANNEHIPDRRGGRFRKLLHRPHPPPPSTSHTKPDWAGGGDTAAEYSAKISPRRSTGN